MLQGFEKMISGMYLGDIVRRVLLRMSEESDDFGPSSSKLAIPFVLRCFCSDFVFKFSSLFILSAFYIDTFEILTASSHFFAGYFYVMSAI